MSAITSKSAAMEFPSVPYNSHAKYAAAAGAARTVREAAKSERKVWLRMPALLSTATLLVVAFAGWAGRTWTELAASSQPLVLYTVTRSDLPITVTERGNLESQKNTEIRCEVETMSGQYGTRIVSIVPNGKAVEGGELLVEFDSAPVKDRLDSQVLAFEQAKAAQRQAAVRFENQKTQNETNLATAQTRFELAEMNLQMYEDGTKGTYRIALADLDLKVQEAKNQIAAAQAALQLQRTATNGMELLYKLGYRGKGDLDQALFKSIQAEDALVRATNSLANAIANRNKLELFEFPMKKLELEGALETAQRTQLQAERDSEALLAQAEAAMHGADRALAKEKERLGKYEAQLTKCKLVAPHAGMAVYSSERTPWGRIVAEGELVVERMKILTLPDLSAMQVKTAIHESVLDQVHEGLAATVLIDAFPDRQYRGTVQSVGVIPTQSTGYTNPDVKVYDTLVTIDEQVEQLKPGMTAVVEIHVDRLQGVLCVPVQAVVQVEDDTWCFVESSGGVERRAVTLGKSNDKFVQIADGVSEGDRVVLNPMTLSEVEESKERTISPES
jgi:RND family efflux transporter MFP subunit